MAGALGVAAAVVALGGCGDDEAPIEPLGTEAEATSPSSVETPEFIQSADARCAEANAAITALTAGSADGSLVALQQAEITQELLGGLQSLGSPEDPSGDLERYYGALEDEIAALEQQGEAAVSPSSPEGPLAAAQEEAASAAEDFGFEECGGTAIPVTPGDSGATAVPPVTTTAPSVPVTPTTTTPAAPIEPAPAPAPVPEPAPPSGGTGAGEPGGGTGTPGEEPSGGGSGGISPG